METADAFEAMAQACIVNHDAVMRQGSPEMQMASRLLLYALAEEIARREADEAVRHRHARHPPPSTAPTIPRK